MSERPAPPKHTTDEEIAAYTVGVVAPHDDVILVVDYDPSWPALFEREAERIRGALGDGVVRLEHVGSTSVPGLAAKPRIDVLLVVDDSSDESTYVPALEAAGYVLRIREPDWFEHRVFKGPETDLNLHVFSIGCVEIERMVRFRDRLRTHDDDRALYERTKRELAARRWKHVQNYADAKTEVVERILERAMRALVEELVEDMDARVVSKIWLQESEDERLGFVVHVGEDHVVLARLFQGSWHNGFVAIRFSAIDFVSRSEDTEFIHRCFAARNEALPEAPPVTAATFDALLGSIGEHFPVVVLTGHGRGALDIGGEVVEVSDEELTLRPLSPKGYWERNHERVPLNRLSLLYFGSRYEETLDLVGRLPDATSAEEPE